MIKNLLFDLGGVILDIKKQDCVDAFKKLGLSNPDEFFGDYSQNGPFLMIEEGIITPKEFHVMVKSLIPNPVTSQQIDDAFMKFLIGIPTYRLHQLLELRKKYKVFLLSNTNRVMWTAKIADEFSKDGLDINAYFDGIVTSFEAKSLKPRKEIFDYAVEHLGIKPEETLFLDDSLKNIQESEKLGFNGAHVKEGTEFMDILATKGLA